jgi:hypothetical protein
MADDADGLAVGERARMRGSALSSCSSNSKTTARPLMLGLPLLISSTASSAALRP